MAQLSTSNATANIDARLLDFVRNQVDTFIKWDLVRFFHDNPFAVDTAANIARFTERDQRKVEQELQELAARGVLETSSAGDQQIYRFVKDADTRALIDRFVTACDDPDFRVRAINQVIEGLQ